MNPGLHVLLWTLLTVSCAVPIFVGFVWLFRPHDREWEQ